MIKTDHRLINAGYSFISAVLIVQFTGCGTILYPERKGQKSGRIDAGVAVLDGIGLLLFIVPGVIAFAVDFNNGTIYLPGTRTSALHRNGIKQIKFDPARTSRTNIERIVQEQTGTAVIFDQPDMRITKLKSSDDIVAQFVKVFSRMRDDRIASVL